jgi:allophanate hydrolase
MRRTAFYGTVMSGGKDHGLLAGATRVAATTTAPAYRLWTNEGRYPLLQRDETVAGTVRCEVWDVPDEVYERIHRSEPPGLVPGTIELADGSRVEAFLADPAFVEATPLVDVTAHGGFLDYLRSVDPA